MCEVGLLADVLEQLRPVFPAQVEFARPRGGIGTGIVDGQFVRNRQRIGTRELLERAKLLGCRQPTTIDPEALVEPGRLDIERVTFPPTDRVAVERRRKIGGM